MEKNHPSEPLPLMLGPGLHPCRAPVLSLSWSHSFLGVVTSGLVLPAVSKWPLRDWIGARRLELASSTVTHLARLVPPRSHTVFFPSRLLLPPPGFSGEVFGPSLVSLHSFVQLRSVELPRPSPYKQGLSHRGSCRGGGAHLCT